MFNLESVSVAQLRIENANSGIGNYVIGPNYIVDPGLKDQGNPKGRNFEFTMRLADSNIFRGTDSTLDPNKPIRMQRKIYVYIPAA